MVICTRPNPPPLGTFECFPVWRPVERSVAFVDPDGVPILVPPLKVVFWWRFDSLRAWPGCRPLGIVLKVPAVWCLAVTGLLTTMVCMAAADWLFKLNPRLHESLDWVLFDCLLMLEGCLCIFCIRVELAVDSRFMNRVCWPPYSYDPLV